MDVNSKVIIVTGASRGIGLAVAKYLLNASHKVVAVSRSTTQLQVLKNQYPSQIQILAADLANSDVGAHPLYSIRLFRPVRRLGLDHLEYLKKNSDRYHVCMIILTFPRLLQR